MGAILGHHGLLLADTGAALWTPASLTVPPAIWLNDTSAVTGASNASQWNDISGNAYHLTQASAGNQPTINATGLDGKRTLSSDTDDYISNGSAGAKALTQNQSSAWFMAVSKCTDATAALRHLFFVSTNNTINARFNIASSNTGGARLYGMRVRRLDADSIATLSISSALDTNPHVLLFTMDWSAGDGTIYIDGAQDAQNLALTTSGSTSNTASAASLGLYSIGSGISSLSETAEIIFGAGGLPSAGEIEKLFGYAHHKWGLESLLPGGHPYKTTPP